MAVEAETHEWVPAQYPKDVDSVDLRRLIGVQPKGYKERSVGKRKRDAAEQAEDEHPMAMQEDMEQQDATQAPKRQKADETMYRPVSGKSWKPPGQRASTVMRPASLGKKSWGKKMTEKASRKHLLDLKAEAVAATKAKRKAAAEQRKRAKELKASNQQKSAVVQKITNSATVKKMMKDKKQRKLLRTADTN
ncbi:hypothetical protein VOLCADRAFT_103666 [Volvox carteri f. nagariensis]|uniref:Coiled-coil domain-containing protein 86 n=1 Tax=Volvox carteri f. nagariensis TaxID=3068 RepID=D8TNP1_VOLCA|nr:uncharacterized protein VOLCADRAFT_103666 [Volvox carteri f. nagariensis]EFJ50874.1 hypothetical protein VOLCADRAFT_103666 [Volvox carteri f. nagariensis]|eukprot:XP_002947886.1 hypothetical protein VOLCADRAFT_103666 [Volvox carteri f. nagariensis]